MKLSDVADQEINRIRDANPGLSVVLMLGSVEGGESDQEVRWHGPDLVVRGLVDNGSGLIKSRTR